MTIKYHDEDPSETPSSTTMDQFILFGDSITQHCFSTDVPPGQTEPPGTFGPKLTAAYIRRLDIINRGLSGYNTRQALAILPRIIPSPSHTCLRFLTIFFGANDARLPDTGPDPQQHVPLLEFKENIRQIATSPLLKQQQQQHHHPNTHVILITPPPTDSRAFARKPGVTALYATAIRDLGAELETPVVDIWTVMTESGVPLRELLHDGLHLTRKGYDLLFDELMRVIRREWPEEMPECLPFVLPKWDDGRAWEGEGRGAVL